MRRARIAAAGAVLAVVAAETGLVVHWLARGRAGEVAERVPLETDVARPAEAGGRLSGKLVKGPGKPLPPTPHPVAWVEEGWPQFRGPRRDGVAPASEKLPADWGEGPLPVLWKLDVGEGHAGAAVLNGRVYLIDYDREKQEDAVRCLSLDDGREIWRFSYPAKVKRNHGMSRTVPAVTDQYVVSIGPLCHVSCLNAATGEPLWLMDLVKDFGTAVPQWYAGQCALIDGDAAILAPGGPALMMAVELKTGKIRWKAPNPGGWQMSHVSIMPMDRGGKRQYLYGTSRGVISVSASGGEVLWTYPEWKMSTPVASPVVIDSDRILLAGGYGFGGSAMIRLSGESPVRVEEVFRLKDDLFGSEQHTPILHEGHVYGVLCRQAAHGGELACIGLDGKVLWTSGRERKFGLGPFTIADGKILALEDQTGILRVFEASPAACRELARKKVLVGHDAWAPMALVGGRLILRDLTQMVCLDVSGGRR